MLAPHPAAWHPDARGPATLALLPCLGGCSEGPAADAGFWWFATAALLLATALAFALGRLLERQRASRGLSAASGTPTLPPEATAAANTPKTAEEAVQALMNVSEAPTLVAQLGTQGWQVLQANAPAQAQWPALHAGAPLSTTQPTPEADNFSFTVSHDLRAPIRVVEGFTRIVKEDYGRQLDRVGNDHLDRVLSAAARMNQMIDALLTLAKLSQQPLARQPVNLSQLAGFVVDDLRRSSPERAADIEIEPGLVAQGDPTLLRLVLENLLGNAWKYSARSLRAHITLHRVVHGAGTAFVVRDNGAGFDMRSSDRLFGLFQRLHSTSEFPGTGVGLASVRRIVQRHGGEIWAEAEVGRGAAFYFTLTG